MKRFMGILGIFLVLLLSVSLYAGMEGRLLRQPHINGDRVVFMYGGDIYCNGDLSGSGNIGGDVFAGGSITATNVVGRKNETVTEAPVTWPGLQVGDFSSQYYIGSILYSTYTVDSNIHPGGTFLPPAGNPAGVRYCTGDIELPGNVNIQGMLVVNGNLRVSGANNVVTAVKNFPALLVGGEVVMEEGGT